MYNKKFMVIALLLIVVSFSVGSFTLYDNIQSNSQELSTQRNYNFDIAIDNIAQPRPATQYDIPVGVVQDAQGNNYQVYESRTVVTNDFSKLFMGGIV
jgi:hypothetical protein